MRRTEHTSYLTYDCDGDKKRMQNKGRSEASDTLYLTLADGPTRQNPRRKVVAGEREGKSWPQMTPAKAR